MSKERFLIEFAAAFLKAVQRDFDDRVHRARARMPGGLNDVDIEAPARRTLGRVTLPASFARLQPALVSNA